MKYGILDYSEECSVEREVITEGEIICYKSKSEDGLPDSIKELDAVMLWHNIYVSKKTIDRLSKCKIIVRVGAGFDNVDCEYAGKLGIPVANTPDYGTNDVADHTMALFLCLCRSIVAYNGALMSDPFNNWRPEIGGEINRLTGREFGIIGLGRIGTSVAFRAKAFGMNVSFYDPYINDGYDKALNITRSDSLEALISECDYISIHTPLTEETNGLINSNVIRKFKHGCILINTSRGKVVDLDAVYEGLRSDTLRAFGADVLEEEPPDIQHPLLAAYKNREKWLDGRMVLTPHSAFYAIQSRYEMRKKAAILMFNATNSIPIRNCINKPFLLHSRSPVL